MLLDVFKGDGFSLIPLTKAMTDLPFVPTKMRDLGLFPEQGITTLDVEIERDSQKLSLVPTAARGAPGVNKGLQRRNVRKLSTVHLPQECTLYADEVLGLRAFGSQTDEEVAMSRLTKKMAVCKRDLELTIEFQRIGAIRGQVLDADGSTVILDLFNEFGITKPTLSIALSNSSTKLLQVLVGLKRQVEDALGGIMMDHIRVECSPEFMDALTAHPAMVDAWTNYKNERKSKDYRDDFEFPNGIVWSEYRGQVGNTKFIPAGKAQVVPMGVPDLFQTWYAPAPYMETVGTEGLPYYAKQKNLDYDVGVTVQTQSNPLHVCTRPQVLIELSFT